MNFAFIISLLFGIGQVVLLSLITSFTAAKRRKELFLVLVIKFLTYGLAALLLVFLYFEYLVDCLCGFAVGMPVTAVLIFVYRAFFKGKIKPFFKYLREKYGLKNL